MSLQRHLSVNPLKLQSRQTWLKFQPCFQSHVAPGDLLRFQPRFHVWATLPRLHTPRAHTGRAIPTASMLRMRLLSWGPTSPFACMLTMGLLKWTWALSCTHSQLWTGQHSSPFRLSPCSQPQSSPQVCPLKPEFQHPAPTCTIRYMSPSGEYSKVARIVCVGLALFCLPQASCCTLPWAFEALTLPVRVLLVLSFFLSALWIYHASPFWPVKFLLKNQPTTLWGIPFYITSSCVCVCVCVCVCARARTHAHTCQWF